MEFFKKLIFFALALISQFAHALTCEEVLRDSPPSAQQAAPLIDSTLSRLLNRPVAYKIFENALPEMQNRSAESKEMIQVPLGKLSQEEFNKLQAYFPFQSQVKWDRNRQYDLVDFLSPVMQALSGKYLRENYDSHLPWMTEEDTEMRTETVNQASNCYTTTWEILRNLALPTNQQVFHGFWWNDRMTMDLLTKANISQVVTEQQAIPGDVVVFFAEADVGAGTFQLLLHTAIRITDDLYFEKPDTMPEYGWRLIRKKTMHNFIAQSTKYLVEDDRYQVHAVHRRFTGNHLLPNPLTFSIEHEGQRATDRRGNPVLMTTETGFGGGDRGSYYSIVPFQIRLDQNSRGTFAPNSELQNLPMRRRN